MNLTIATLILAGAILILGSISYLNIHERRKARARVERERAEREEKERARKLAAQQQQAGRVLFVELTQAAIQNKMANVLSDGKISEKTGLIEVERQEQNGRLGYSITISMPNPTCLVGGGLRKPGYILAKININLEKTGKEIHVLKGPYGPERDYSAAEFDNVRFKLYGWVKAYRLFAPASQPIDDSIFTPIAEVAK